MRLLGLAVCVALAAASSEHPSLFKDSVPKAWKNAKWTAVTEKVNLVERVRRALSAWMGFDKVILLVQS